MNSLQVIDIFFPHIDGVVNTVDNYARFLNGAEGDYCCVFAPENREPGVEIYRGYDVFRAKAARIVGGYLCPLPGMTKSLKTVLKGRRFDVIHAHSPFTMGHFAYRCAKKNGALFICTFHSKYYDDFLRVTRSKLISKLLTKYILRLYNKADEVWAVSPGTALTLRGYGFKGEIKVMPNGTDMLSGDLSGAKERAAAEFGISSGGKTLIFVGSQIWHKNLKLVIDTLALLKGKGYRLISVGDGADWEEIKEYAASAGVRESVIFTGKVSDRELLAGLYLNADLLFFPSEYDNAPLVLREASSLELPSMLLRGSNSADCLTGGVDCFLCPPDAPGCSEAIESAFADREKLRSVGKKAKESVCIPWSEVAADAAARYKKLLDGKKRR